MLRPVAAALASLLTAATCPGQVGMDGPGADVIFAAAPTVQEDVGLPAGVRAELSALRVPLLAARRDFRRRLGYDKPFFPGRSAPRPELEQKQIWDATQAYIRAVEPLDERVAELLTPAQLERIRQVRRQRGGAVTLPLRPALLRELHVTDEQQDEFTDVLLNLVDERRAQPSADTEAVPLSDQQRREALVRYEARVERTFLDVLSPDQQAEYRRLIGEPLDVPDEELRPDRWDIGE